MSIIQFCTSSASKYVEFQRMLEVPLQRIDTDLTEIQTLDAEFACKQKALQAHEKLGDAVLVDDTGLELLALSGFPGALVRWAMKGGGSSILFRMLPADAEPIAVAATSIGFADGNGVTVFSGRVEGSVIAAPRGENGFGFDDVFVPKGNTKTFAEMTDLEKDLFSPRSIALRKMKEYLIRCSYSSSK